MLFHRQWPAFLWALFILIITGIPGSYIPEVVTFWEWLEYDKIVHLLVFAILSFLILYGYREQYSQRDRRYIIVIGAVVVTSIYGLITELMQHYVFIGRFGNVYDTIADCLGALLGWVIFRWMARKKILINNSNS